MARTGSGRFTVSRVDSDSTPATASSTPKQVQCQYSVYTVSAVYKESTVHVQGTFCECLA